MQRGRTIMAGSLHRVAAAANVSVPASVSHCSSSPESSLTPPLNWHFSLTVPLTSQASHIFKGPALLAFNSLRKFIIMCCTKLWQLSLNGGSLDGICRRIRLSFTICRHCFLCLSSRNRMCSLYNRKLSRNKLHAARSARPTTPATASVCIGCAAKAMPVTAVPTLIQYAGSSRRAVTTTKAVAVQWNITLRRW